MEEAGRVVAAGGVMAHGDEGAVLRQVRRLFGTGTVAGLAEGPLLDRFVSRGDEAAFEALVARHGPMVLGVCRQMLRDPNDVDDAFQATFLVLVRRAGSIRRRDRLGPWLHGVAYRVSTRARRLSAARRSLADDVADVPRPCEAERSERAEALHEEVARLPEPYRAPIVLCYLEGLTHDEAAARLGWPVGTVRGRLARARDRLRDRLARRGQAPAEGPAAMVALLDGVRATVPARLAEATIRTATGKATAGLLSSHVLVLAEGVMQAMLFSKLKLIATALVTVAVVAAGTGVLAYQGRGPDPSAERPDGAPENAPPSGPPEADAKRDKPRPIETKALLHVDDRKAPDAEQREDERSLQLEEARARVEFLKIEAETARPQFQNTAQVLSRWEVNPEAFQGGRGGFGGPRFQKGNDEANKAQEKQLRDDFERAKALYVETQAKLRREERRLAQLEGEASGRPKPDANPPKDVQSDDGRIDRLEEARIEVELLRAEVAEDQKLFQKAATAIKQGESAGKSDLLQSLPYGLGGVFLGGGKPPQSKEEVEQARKFHEEQQRIFEMRMKEAKQVLEESRARYLADQIKLAHAVSRLARLEGEAGGQPGTPKTMPDLERRLSEIEAKLNRLLESAEGQKAKAP